ncbi:cell death in tomato 1 [Zopfia rhizophila CBS 207.26]|uniref:Cell death in tomato 1 n=1 Tax=Zopfia rhizophila CBS 207.26 TaxID=1314779 RepID=A0A6A6ERI7_9PEZI|nr:cell death in tomato 1 [Zopfia rhizophila CBS 207.26]
MFAKTILPLLVAAVAAAPTAPVERQEQELQPWQIRPLYTHSPSGRLGNDPHSTLNFTIHDPNTIRLQPGIRGWAVLPPVTVNCSAQWLTNEDVPWGVGIPCTAVDYGTWTFTMVPGSGEAGYGATTDFGLEFKQFRSVNVLGNLHERTFEGEGKFKVGVNLSGQCGGSGVCNWGLTETPYLVQQTLTQCAGELCR